MSDLDCQDEQAIARRKHIKKRRSNGQCAWGGCEEYSGEAYHCEPHALKTAGYVAKSRAKDKVVEVGQ